MAKRPDGAVVAVFADREAATALHRQIFDRLRAAILDRSLAPGARLPSTRTLARDLGVSRNTVVAAVEQLVAEGYLEAKVGAGTYVASTLPDDLLTAAPLKPPPAPKPMPVHADDLRPLPFRVGMPALDLVPIETWRRLMARTWRTLDAGSLHYGAAEGWPPLRRAVASYLATARGVRCAPEQVLVLSSCQAALDLCARLLVQPGERVWVEEPGYIGAREAFRARGCRLVPVPVDQEGIDIARVAPEDSAARLAYVTPSCQYPLGMTLSLRRRLALLAWARDTGSWIVEDDYDSEYRYEGRPLAALQGLDQAGRVLYVGTFNKVLFPTLRLAYLVVPPDLVDRFAEARRYIDGHSPIPEQRTLHAFIEEGHFAAHLRRTRIAYHQRQSTLVQALAARLGGLVEATPQPAGMQIVARLTAGIDDALLQREADRIHLTVTPLSRYHLGAASSPGVLLGYSGFTPETLLRAVDRLTPLVERLAAPRAA
ncbi:MAG: PLP-dependent aminotransferase family protein [Alphaproteobacteria bacterium]|nr:PLP-dependent aminotransferase family protein [Alphaproteobacteria bacterium]